MLKGWRRALVFVAVGLGLFVLGVRGALYYAERQATAMFNEAVRSGQIQGSGRAPLAPQGARATVTSPLATATAALGPSPSAPPRTTATPGLALAGALSPLPVTGIPAVAPPVQRGVEPPPVSGDRAAPASQPPAAAPPVVERQTAVPPPAGSIPGQPSVAIIGLSIFPPNPVRGQTVNGSIQVVNRGTGDATEVPVHIEFEYQLAGQWIGLADFWGSLGSMGPGQNNTVQQGGTVPEAVLPGRYRVTISVDPSYTDGANAGDGRRSVELVLQ